MLFNSIEYIIFLPLVFLLYWFVFNKNNKQQNILILIASYIFYGWWDYRFLSLIILSSIMDFSIGLLLGKTEENKKRKLLLYISIIGNLSILMGFKYFDFFTDNFINLLGVFGMQANPFSINVLLPIGISFYTFQTMSYSIDIYEKRMKPSRDIIAFFCYVSFFPQLVAGPIERAKNLLPQFLKERKFSYENAIDGTRQILWGFFKKIVVADNLLAFNQHLHYEVDSHTGLFILILTFFTSIMVYADFSGYSDIAIGTARLFGFKLQQNFSFPFFSKTLSEFWKRWHKSLFSWLLYYLYRPLQGAKKTRTENKTLRNLFILFVISGLWHGAAWGFIIWGALHALIMIIERKLKIDAYKNSFPSNKRRLPNFKDIGGAIYVMFIFMTIGIFFQNLPLQTHLDIVNNLFIDTFKNPLPQFQLLGIPPLELMLTFLYVFILFSIEWFNKYKLHGLEQLPKNRVLRWLIYILLSLLIIEYFGTAKEFIYYQF